MKLEKSQIKIEIEKWRKILHIEPIWNITFDIRDSSNDMSSGNEDSVACIAVDLRYFIANIEFNAPEIQECDLQAIILHELLHILIEGLACSSGCGLGEKFEEINIILTESTIERLSLGYLYLYNVAYGKKEKKNIANKKKASRALKCRRGSLAKTY